MNPQDPYQRICTALASVFDMPDMPDDTNLLFRLATFVEAAAAQTLAARASAVTPTPTPAVTPTPTPGA